MSDQNRISPLLDGFTLGNPMSSRSGVRCYPAIKENSDKKYIVKAISIPASQVQLDALLLTGAYKDPAEAMDYFKELANGIEEEAKCLQLLSRLEGFLPYESWQVEPMENGQLGYRIFLISSFKRSLDKYLRRNLMTHLEAVNLGLDLCAALSICRRAGWLYVDLKPTNIFLSGEREYRIGDLGFVKLDSLKFTSLPAKYVSPYSPPELHDALNPINESADTYALGMLLYQIYNDGHLPFRGKAPAEALPSPCNADYEMAEIIMKAIHPDAKQRWTDPLEMGKALAAYLQRNTVNNDPISKLSVPVADPEPAPETAAEPVPAVPDPEPAVENAESEAAPVQEEPVPAEPEPAESEAVEPEPERIPVAPGASAASPEILTPTQEDEDLFDFDLEGLDLREYNAEEEEIPSDEPEAYTDSSEEAEPIPAEEPKRKWILPLVLILILGLLGAGGFWFYENYYLQTIDSMTVEGDADNLQITLDTQIDNTLLQVSCTDTYGNTLRSDVVDGKAAFTDLKPGTQYHLEVEIEGFHKLKGFTSEYFTTSNTTDIVSFTAVTGAEDGSVMLTLTIDGAAPQEWVVTYGTDGESYKTQSFTGKSVTIRELTVGKEYTFTLQTMEELNLTGQTEISFTASRLVLASNLHVVSCIDGNLTLRWTGPEDVVVPSWTVRCLSEDGQQQMVTTDTNEAVIPSVDTTKACTLEVLAEGMTQAARANITANPLTIHGITVDEADPEALTVTWDFQGDAPEGGWLLMYSIDGSDYQSVIKCDTPSAVISPRIHGATYHIEIRSASGVSIFDNLLIYDSPNARIFEQYDLPAKDISAHLLVTPEVEGWTYRNVTEEDYTLTFTQGQPISILLNADREFHFLKEDVNLLYVIRDSSSNVLSELTAQETRSWWDMWVDEDHHFCELDLPKLPEYTGNYSLALYFNGYAVMTIDFTITQ